MKKREFFNSVQDCVKCSIADCIELESKIKAHEQKIKAARESRFYTKEMVDGLYNDLQSLKNTLKSRLDACNNEVTNLTKEYCGELRAMDAMRGEELTPDADLLKYKLKKSDYTEMLKRNEGNRTMTRLILDSAKDAGIELGVHYAAAADEAKQIEFSVPHIASVVTRWYNKPELYDEFMGDSSDFASQFAVDD